MKLPMRILFTLTLMAAIIGIQNQAQAVGDAGCGLGAVIIQKNAKGLQLLASTTNVVVFPSQVLGIIFGTSGCSSSGIVMNDKEIEYYVEVNQHDLNREIAQGKGDKVKTLASLHGCKTANSETVFISKLKTHFAEISPSADTKSTEMAANLKKLVTSDSEIQTACTVASN